jgi:hypothetical protein
MSRYVPALQSYAPVDGAILELLEDRAGTLRLVLDSRGTKIDVAFDGPLAYRRLDEGDDLVALESIQAPGLTFYTVEESDFVSWFIERGHGIRATQTICHYVVVAVDDIIDVLSLDAPDVVIRAPANNAAWGR